MTAVAMVVTVAVRVVVRVIMQGAAHERKIQRSSDLVGSGSPGQVPGRILRPPAMHRRSFLAAAVGTLAAACAKRPRTAVERRPVPRIGPVGLQLYTVRTLMEKDMPGTLQQVAAIGYREVEFAGYFGRTPAEVRALLARVGLTSPSSHTPYELLVGNWQKALDDANAVGHQWVTIPWLAPEQRPTSVAGWQRLAATLARGAEQAHASGLRFAYHNHDFEITPVEGVMPLEVLLRDTDPTRVDFEMDVYWVTKAGADAVSLLARHPGRFKMLHLKDATPAPQRAFADVGSGTIDWPAVLAQRATAGVEHVFVERDESPDPMASIRNSYAYLASLK